jgi:hypothetical protein
LERLHHKSKESPYDSLNLHCFADNLIILVNHHRSKQWMEPWVQVILRQHLITLQVQVNAEKTRVVTTLEGEAFSPLSFDVRRVLNRRQQPRPDWLGPLLLGVQLEPRLWRGPGLCRDGGAHTGEPVQAAAYAQTWMVEVE